MSAVIMPIAIERLTIGNGHIDLTNGRVFKGNLSSPLTRLEVRLLRYLADRPGEIVSAVELLTEVWGYSPRCRTRTLATTIHRIRQKIEDNPSLPEHLLSYYGRGYSLHAERSMSLFG